MRKLLALAVVCATIGMGTWPALAESRVTVEQLEELVKSAQGKSDSVVARQLAEIALKERFDTPRLLDLEKSLPGSESRQALLLLADTSAFLPLPASQMRAAPPPPFAVQRQLMARTVTYASETLHQLPNFSAVRVTTRFEDRPQGFEKGGTVFVPAEPMRLAGTSRDGVIYRNGAEVVETANSRNKQAAPLQGLTASGEFGPILATVLVDAAHSKLGWSHWEESDGTLLAVFAYVVPREQSRYEVSYCCVKQAGSTAAEARAFRQTAGYHGEMAVDPGTGTVLRLTLQADLKSTDPMIRADMLVEYGRVEIGGKFYICPVKSVSLSLAQAIQETAMQNFRTAGMAAPAIQYAPGHLQTLLNDVSFEDYHLFRAASRLMAANEVDAPAASESPATMPAAVVEPGTVEPGTAEPGTTDSASAEPKPVAASAASSGTETKAAEEVAPATADPPSVAAALPVKDAINETDSGEPDFGPGFSPPGDRSEVPVFKARTQAVVVDVVVTKGNDEAVPALRKEDFQVTEDGQAQTVDLFEEHPGETLPPRAPTKMPPHVFTNEPAAPPGDAVNVLLLDSLNTAPQDQVYVHKQIMDFLTRMQPGTRVAIFTLGAQLRFVQGFTDDGATLRAALNDKHNANLPQKAPASRNLQDDIDDKEEVQMMQAAVGGTSKTPMSTAGIDELVQAQAGVASYQADQRVTMTLDALRHLALYLAGVPGRKNLIWFSSSFPVSVFPKAREKRSGNSPHDAESAGRQTADLLTLSKVAIYPVGAEGLAMNHTTEVQAEITTPDASAGNMGPYNDANNERATRMAAMEQLASDTGGEAIFNTNDLSKALARVVGNGSHYYTLVYTPANKEMDGKFRRIEVKIQGRKYKLAYRHGYYADAAAESEAQTSSDPLRPLLAYGMPSVTQMLYGVRVLPAATQPAAAAKRAGGNDQLSGPVTRYSVDFMIRWTEIDLQPNAQGKQQGRIQLGLIAYGRDGKAVNWVGEMQAMNLNAATFAAIQRSGVPAHLEIDLPPGEMSLATGVYDYGSRRAGTMAVPLTSTLPPVTASLGQKK